MEEQRSTANQQPPRQEGLEDEAAPVLVRRRRPLDQEIDITPMIDCVFLLLIFFLVAAKMESQASVELPPARYGKPVAAKNAVILVANPGGAQGVVVTTGHGDELSPSDLAEQEAKITRYVDAGLSGRAPFHSAKDHVLIKAGRSVKHRDVARVAAAAGKAREGQQLYIAVLEDQ